MLEANGGELHRCRPGFTSRSISVSPPAFSALTNTVKLPADIGKQVRVHNGYREVHSPVSLAFLSNAVNYADLFLLYLGSKNSLLAPTRPKAYIYYEASLEWFIAYLFSFFFDSFFLPLLIPSPSSLPPCIPSPE